jgi:drug/metabolite transporter (DMT)-like permease
VPSDPTLGAVCALTAALAWSITSLLARSLMVHYSSVAINAVRSGIAGTLLVGWVTASEGPATLVAMSGATFLVLAFSIVAAIGIGDTVFFESTRAIGLGRAMTIATTYPVGAALLAAAFFDERITTSIATGTLLTLGGVALIVSVRGTGEARPERLWFGVSTAVIASVAWAVSTAMMKAPLDEIEPLTAGGPAAPGLGAALPDALGPRRHPCAAHLGTRGAAPPERAQPDHRRQLGPLRGQPQVRGRHRRRRALLDRAALRAAPGRDLPR